MIKDLLVNILKSIKKQLKTKRTFRKPFQFQAVVKYQDNLLPPIFRQSSTAYLMIGDKGMTRMIWNVSQ